MNKLKGLSFIIGFTLLFCFPAEEEGIIIYGFIVLPIAILLLYLSGAFKSQPTTKKNKEKE